MSVLINMEMPTSCYLCPCNKDDGFGFFTCGVTYCECDFMVRPATCPLVPVPKHGRLIDADALENRVVPASRFFEIPNANVVVLGVIKAAPTIIPADEPFGKPEQLNL